MVAHPWMHWRAPRVYMFDLEWAATAKTALTTFLFFFFPSLQRATQALQDIITDVHEFLYEVDLPAKARIFLHEKIAVIEERLVSSPPTAYGPQHPFLRAALRGAAACATRARPTSEAERSNPNPPANGSSPPCPPRVMTHATICLAWSGLGCEHEREAADVVADRRVYPGARARIGRVSGYR